MANKVYVVGFPRSGTSLTMQTLFHLKFPVFGIPHPPNLDPDMQPDQKPFWEFPRTLSGDVGLLGVSKCAVKVLLRKAIENIVLDDTDKVIFCKRNPEVTAQAMIDWEIGTSYERNLKLINQWYPKFEEWVGDTPYLSGDLDEALSSPERKEQVATNIRNFVGLDTDITDALENAV